MTAQYKCPIRIILKDVKSDAHGVAVQTDYVTVDIDNAEIEKTFV